MRREINTLTDEPLSCNPIGDECDQDWRDKGEIAELHAQLAEHEAFEADCDGMAMKIKLQTTDLMKADDLRLYQNRRLVGLTERLAEHADDLKSERERIEDLEEINSSLRIHFNKLEVKLLSHSWVSVEDAVIGEDYQCFYENLPRAVYGQLAPSGNWFSSYGSVMPKPQLIKPIHLPDPEAKNTVDFSKIEPATHLHECKRKVNEDGNVMCGRSKAIGHLAGRSQYTEFCSKRCTTPEPKAKETEL